MPRKLINNYTFYKIVCLDNAVDLRYVGSTADFNKRKSTHKQNCNNENGEKYNYKVYRTIRDNGGWSNFKIIEIAKQDQLTLREAEQIEERYRLELNADMNGRSCFRTEEERKEQCKEWRENNPEYNKEKSKEWRENNPEYMKDWRKNNKEHLKKYNQTESRKAKNVANSKDWRENNPDYNKKYAQTETAKANRVLHNKKYREKKKLEKLQKEQLKNNKE